VELKRSKYNTGLSPKNSSQRATRLNFTGDFPIFSLYFNFISHLTLLFNEDKRKQDLGHEICPFACGYDETPLSVIICVCFRLFEEAATKLNLVGMIGFLQQLRKASQSQLFDSVTETGDYSLAMPGKRTQICTQQCSVPSERVYI